QWRGEAKLRAARHPGYRHASPVAGLCSSASRRGSAAGTLRCARGGRTTLQSRKPCLECFQLCTRALEHPGRGVGFVTAHEVELAQPLTEHSTEIALQVRLHAA